MAGIRKLDQGIVLLIEHDLDPDHVAVDTCKPTADTMHKCTLGYSGGKIGCQHAVRGGYGLKCTGGLYMLQVIQNKKRGSMRDWLKTEFRSSERRHAAENMNEKVPRKYKEGESIT